VVGVPVAFVYVYAFVAAAGPAAVVVEKGGFVQWHRRQY
jgi:hypothetical protein